MDCHKAGIYERYIKRILDIVLSFLALLILSPLLLVLTLTGTIFMKGNPFFAQLRPGKDEKIFKLVKFRTMTNQRDKHGKLLPDEKRLIPYGKFLRSTSLDELPELYNILVGDMSIVGPRPLLVEYLPHYTEREKIRHSVRSGLTGLAQVYGRNYLPWEERLEKDVEYVENISFITDCKIIMRTVMDILWRKNIAVNTDEIEGNLADIRLKNKETH